MKLFTLLARLLMKTPEQGGDTLVHAALDPDLTISKKVYLENCRPARNSSFTSTVDNQAKLWGITCSLLGIDEFAKVS